MSDERIDEIADWQMYRALVKAETAKHDVLKAMAERYGETAVGKRIARHQQASAEMIKCWRDAGRAAYRRAKEES